MSQLELLRRLLKVLGELEIDHMLVGSHASSFYGEPRSTHDVDLVIDLDPAKIPELTGRFDPERYYISGVALREGRMANLIDTRSGDKIDCFLLGNDVVDRESFSRRRKENIMGVELYIASPEDLILSKLRWIEMSGGSSQQERDIREIVRHQIGTLDRAYLQTQAVRMGLDSRVKELWDAAGET